MKTKLTDIRCNAPRKRFPVFISNSGRSHQDAHRVARDLSEEYDVKLTYKRDKLPSKQGCFRVDARELNDLEIDGLNTLIHLRLQQYPEAYDVADPCEDAKRKHNTNKRTHHRIKASTRRSGSLVATCEVCGYRGGPDHVPYIVDYWPEPLEAKSGPRAYRCERHKPGSVSGDVLELEKGDEK